MTPEVTKKGKTVSLSEIDQGFFMQFKGSLTQSCLLNILGILNSQILQNQIRRKLFSVFIEMFQNLVLYGYRFSENTETSGIFSISEELNKITLSIENLVLNTDINPLKTKIDFINSLNVDELNYYYNQNLIKFDQDNERAGLGLMDIRIKSNNVLNYELNTLNELYSSFKFSVDIQKIN